MASWGLPLYIRYSLIRLRAVPTLTSGASQVLFTITSQNLRVASWGLPISIRYSPIRLRVVPTLTSGASEVVFSGTPICQSESTGGIMGIAHIYSLFTDQSEGSSYPDLGSIPGPFLWHNYQPVASWGLPISIRYSPIRLRVDPTLTSGASQVHFFGTVISRAESVCGIMGLAWIYPYSVICSYLYHCQQKHLQSLWLMGED